MPPLVPYRFLVRLAHRCPYLGTKPKPGLELPVAGLLRNRAELDDRSNFADVRTAWNEFGLMVSCEVSGKTRGVEVDPAKPKSSDGLSLWIDTRDARTSHRASRYCHQFHLLPGGAGGSPQVVQSKINRAQIDAPMAEAKSILIAEDTGKGRYRLSAFFPSTALTGFDPEQHSRWGICYHVRDAELGDQFLGPNADFPFSDDPSLWDTLDLAK